MESGKLFFYQTFDNFLVDSGADHILEVIKGHYILDYVSKRPKSFFFCHYLEETPDYEVEALTIANVDISVSICCTNSLNSVQDVLPQLFLQGVFPLVFLFIVFKECFVGESPRHIDCDLMSVCSWVTSVQVLDQCKIV